MQTFQIRLALDVAAVVTSEFLAESRFEAQAEGASTFLKWAQAEWPEDDDQFMLAVTCNALRSQIRHDTVEFLLHSGVGGRVSPLEILSRECSVPKRYSETPPNTEERELKVDTLTLGFDPGTPGHAVQHLVEARAEVQHG